MLVPPWILSRREMLLRLQLKPQPVVVMELTTAAVPPWRRLVMYLAEDAQPEEDHFSLLQFWQRRSNASTCAETG